MNPNNQQNTRTKIQTVTVTNQNLNQGNEILYIDIRSNFIRSLLERFYDELMVPSFPIKEELEDLDSWITMLESAGEDPNYPDFHVVVALNNKNNAALDQAESGYPTAEIVGGVVFEYYRENNCSCVSYLIVSPKCRGRGLARDLIQAAVNMLEKIAHIRGHLAGCNAIFLETNSLLVDEKNDVLAPSRRHGIFHKMGWRLLDFDYVQPPLSQDAGKCKFLLLCVLLSPHIPREEVADQEKFYVPSALVKSFIRGIWSMSCTRLEYQFWTKDPDFLRMMDQLSRREKIYLLDLPWERPWTLVDLNESFDLELMVRFYQDIMVPNFPRKDELDPLENWLKLLPPNQDEKHNTEDFHVLLALKYPDDDNYRAQKPIIVGGLVFEYYHMINCGFLTYLLVPDSDKSKDRGERMALSLIQRAVEICDKNAIARGHLAGCNAVFLETSSTELTKSPNINTPITEIAQKHSVLHHLGFRMLDFDYVQPPLSVDRKKCKNLFLTVLLSDCIPKLHSESGAEYHYMPRSLLRTFIEVFWGNQCSRISYEYKTDTDYRRMMDQVNRREKIPLLDLPWERPWTLVDLGEDYDKELLVQFYNNMLKPHAPEAELDPIDNLINILSNDEVERNDDLHVVVALNEIAKQDKPHICGGLIFEYYSAVNCGFIKYVLADPTHERADGMAWAMVEYAVDMLDQNAVSRGHLAGCNAIFMEANVENITKKQADIRYNHTSLEKMGWRMLDLDYFHPPFKPGKKGNNMALTVFLTPKIPKVPHEEGDYIYYYLPRSLIKNFISDFWTRESLRVKNVEFAKDPDYLRIMDQLSRREKIPLLDLPWERPWTLVDLTEDFDLELMKQFYTNFLEPSVKFDEELEPLEYMVKVLESEEKEDPRIEDMHILLSLKYQNQAGSQQTHSQPTVIGGLLFFYFTTTNCGLLKHLAVPNGEEGAVMARALVEEAVEIIEMNAKQRGQIAGCNAIFMETKTTPSETGNQHGILHQLGWRCLDIVYAQPPLVARPPPRDKLTPLILTVFLTNKIPKKQKIEGNANSGEVSYIPRELLRSFLHIYWLNMCGRVGYPFRSDFFYKTMMQQIDSKERIHLLDLPWDQATFSVSMKAKL